jgi:hypothetical protein
MVSASLNGAWFSIGDFTLDASNNIYVADQTNYRILKYTAAQLSYPTVFASTSSSSSSYQSQKIFIDSKGTLFSAETWVMSFE